MAVFKAFERKDRRAKAMAATNLAFLHALEGDAAQAQAYAEMALARRAAGKGSSGSSLTTTGTAAALVNMGNAIVQRAEAEAAGQEGEEEDELVASALLRAKGLYLEATARDGDCVEALFNLGLVCLRLGQHADSRRAYERLHALLPDSLEVGWLRALDWA